MAAEPEWSDFRVLVALARAGSVAGAARELHVDHSTVSRRLAALEAAVGTMLVIRGGREFNLTADGRSLLAAAEAMQAAATPAVLAIRRAKAGLAGLVRVSVAPGFVPPLMRLLLPPLRVQHPELEVELVGAYHRADIAHGEVDIALRMVRPTEPDLVARRAVETGWFLFASRDYLDLHGWPASPADLGRHRLVLYVEAMHNVPALRWIEQYRCDGQHAFRVDNLEIARDAMSADAGIGVLPYFIAATAPNLMRVLPEPVDVNVGWIVYHETQRDTARIRAVASALPSCFETHAEWFSGFIAPQAKPADGA